MDIDISGDPGRALAWLVNSVDPGQRIKGVDWSEWSRQSERQSGVCDAVSHFVDYPSPPRSPWQMYGPLGTSAACPQHPFLGPVKTVCSRPVVDIHLPSYTSIETADPAWNKYCKDVLDFASAFNQKYSSSVRIVSFSPVRVYVSDPAVPQSARLKQSDAALLALSQDVTSRKRLDGNAAGFLPQSFRLGITQADSVVEQVPSIGVLNRQCEAAGTELFSILGMDWEDPNIHAAWGTKLAAIGARVEKGDTGIRTVTIAGTTKLTARNLRDVVKLAPVQGVTFVGIPEIYDLAYGGCRFVPALCEWAITNAEGVQTRERDCTVPIVTASSIAQGVRDLFESKACTTAVGVNPADAFLTVNTAQFQTWPGFSIQQPPVCFPKNSSPDTITGMSQIGCNNFSTFTVAQFVSFMEQFAERTAAERLMLGHDPDQAVPVMLYEAAYIPNAWMRELVG